MVFEAPGLPAFSPVLHRERELRNRQRTSKALRQAISQEMLFQSTKQNFSRSICHDRGFRIVGRIDIRHR